MARKVLGYLRVSTSEQVAGFGLDVQAKAIKDYCKANGLRLARTFSDAGLSGSNGLATRPELREALQLIEGHEADGIVVYRLDRLARDLILQETLVIKIREAGAAVLSVTEPDIDSAEPTRTLVRQVLGCIAEYERGVIRQRMMAGKAAKVARGGYGGGRPPFGWRAEGRELVPEPGEQATIALVRRLSA